MKPAPTFPEVKTKLTELIAGRISREEADRWAGQWIYASEEQPARRRWASCSARRRFSSSINEKANFFG
jgi:hypothetical protein